MIAKSTEPTILFGLGSTKAGTSWFYRYLETHPEVHTRSIKELHYFDALESGNGKWQSKNLHKNLDALKGVLDPDELAKSVSLRGQVEDHLELLQLHKNSLGDNSAYLAYLNRGRSDQKLVADVTPAYGLLPRERLAQMATIAPTVRFLYILRDPVDRLWSQIRMLAKRRVGKASGIQAMSERILWRFGRGRFRSIWERCDYRATLENLDSVLGKDQLFTVFYEDLFTQKTIDRICNFLGIRNSVAKLNRRVHKGERANMDENMLTHARSWLAPQYEFALQRFGALPEEWLANAHGSKVQGIKL